MITASIWQGFAAMCVKINGVAKLHSELIKETIFKHFFKLYPEKFTNVTNGVTFRRWALKCNPSLAKFFDETIGPGWVTDYKKFVDLRKFANDPKSKSRFSEIKEEAKAKLIFHLAGIREKKRVAAMLFGLVYSIKIKSQKRGSFSTCKLKDCTSIKDR